MDDGVRPIEINPQLSLSKLILRMPTAIKAATRRPVGFVLDIDTTPTERWTDVTKRLKHLPVDLPSKCPEDGYIGRLNEENRPSFGIWLMPDCKTDGGTLETLLDTLIPANDLLRAHAQASTATARGEFGAGFKPQLDLKAVIHCWLAWQEVPGMPYGKAVAAKYFGQDSPEAIAFLRWLGRLFAIDKLQNVFPAS